MRFQYGGGGCSLAYEVPVLLDRDVITRVLCLHFELRPSHY